MTELLASEAEAREKLSFEYARNARVIDSIRIWKRQAGNQKRSAARFAVGRQASSLKPAGS